MNPRRIRAARRPLDLCFQAPPSKSVTHRALIAAALAEGSSTVLSPLLSEDTRVTLHGLQALGFEIQVAAAAIRVSGRAGAVPGGAQLGLEQSGTSLRFLLALAALGTRPSRLDGSPRLRRRPALELVRALRELGADVRPADSPSGLPLAVGGRAPQGGAARVAGGRSSQFASALLLTGPAMPRGLDLTLVPPVVSLPYVDLTLDVLARFGIVVQRPEPLRFSVARTIGRACEFRVDGDHSSASYFLAAAAVAGGRVRVRGLDPASAQPDARLARILSAIGCRTREGPDWIEVQGAERFDGFALDLGQAPDLVPTLAVTALFAAGPSALRGIPHLRDKESDRLRELVRNLRALGAAAEVLDDGLAVDPRCGELRGAPVRCAADHRLAMAFAVAGLRLDGVSIDDPSCVDKSNPHFWREFQRMEG